MNHLKIMVHYQAQHDAIIDQAGEIQKKALNLQILKCLKPDQKFWNTRKLI